MRCVMVHGSDSLEPVLAFFRTTTGKDKRIVQFPPMVTLKDLADLRARIVDATIRVVEASSVTGSGSTLAAVLPRKFEPRNRDAEQK